MKKCPSSIYDAYFYWKEQGLDPIPIPYVDGHPVKYPSQRGWVEMAEAGHSPEDFKRPCNLGSRLGGEKNVSDIDLDDLLAGVIGKKLLLARFGKTLWFGHKSKPSAHFFYFTDQSFPTEQIRDPIPTNPEDKSGPMIVEFRCVSRKGKRSIQAVLPPSLHYDPKTGVTEPIEMDADCGPIATVSALQLREAFRLIGVITLLAKYFPVASNRHDTLLALAGVFVRKKIREEDAVNIICTAYEHSGGYNFDLEKAESDLRSVYKTYQQSPSTHLYGYSRLIEIMPERVVEKVLELLDVPCDASTANKSEQEYYLTDTGNGRWFVDTFRDRVRFERNNGIWYVYDGKRWVARADAEVTEFAKQRGEALRRKAARMRPPAETGDQIIDAANQKQFESIKKSLLKSANQAESVTGYKATLIAASTDPRIICKRSDFDTQSNLLNVANGVLNLYTGGLLPHDPEYMISKLCPTPYEPALKHDDWENVLVTVCRNHEDLRDFLQVMAGYSAQGDKSEERVFIAYGPGGTGKGTFMDGIASTLGSEYVLAVAPETVLKQQRNSASASSDIARLNGCRIMIVSELEKGARVQESFMKSFTGNDLIVARHLWKGEEEFRSQAQPWFQTNHRIGFDSTDGGNTRRYLEIPFDNVLQATEMDKSLKFRVRQDQEIHKAILAWIVEGCKRWKQQGFVVPASVRDATDQLFETNDFLSGFLADCCERGLGKTEVISDLRNAYEMWCYEQEIEPAKGKTFKDMLEERGLHQKTDGVKTDLGKSTTVRQWHGLTLNKDWKAKAKEWKARAEQRQEEERIKNKLALVAQRKAA